MTELGKAAIAYAALGVPIFPLYPKSKFPLRGSNGVKDATTDTAGMAEAWAASDWNIAGAMGNGIFALDIDPRNGGVQSLLDMTRGHRALPITWESASGRGDGGVHYFFRGNVRSTVLRPGLDVVSAGKYVVLPPSVHPDTGQAYTWRKAPWEFPIAEAPKWLADEIGRPRNRDQDYIHPDNVDPESFVLGMQFKERDALGDQVRPGVFRVLCPNRDKHSAGSDYDGSTIVFAPRPGYRVGAFHCSHSHCKGLNVLT